MTNIFNRYCARSNAIARRQRAWALRRYAALGKHPLLVVVAMNEAADILDRGDARSGKRAEKLLAHADKMAKSAGCREPSPSSIRPGHVVPDAEEFTHIVSSISNNGELEPHCGATFSQRHIDFYAAEGFCYESGGGGYGTQIAAFSAPDRTHVWLYEDFPMYIPQGVVVDGRRPDIAALDEAESAPTYCTVCERYHVDDGYSAMLCEHVWFCGSLCDDIGPGREYDSKLRAHDLWHVCDSDDCFGCEHVKRFYADRLDRWVQHPKLPTHFNKKLQAKEA